MRICRLLSWTTASSSYVKRLYLVIMPCCEGLFYMEIECICPRVSAIHAPVDTGQVMHNIAAADDEHAFIPQRHQRLTSLKAFQGRAAGIDAQLKGWYIRIGIHEAEDTPSAMIQATVRHFSNSVLCQYRDPLCPFRRTWGRVGDLKQAFGETIKIVNSLRFFGRRDKAFILKPSGLRCTELPLAWGSPSPLCAIQP